MKLIGAGLPRTATLSQKMALEMLGLGPCYHMVNVLADLGEAAHWRRALDGEGPWQEVFGECQSTVDWPGSFFYEELIDVYPEAKVVLSLRDPEGWERSMRETIWGVLYGGILIRHLSDARSAVDPKWHSYIELMKEMWRRSGLMKGEHDTTAEWMRSAFDQYTQEVQERVPSERLLVWSVAEGWERLCEFLDVPIPDAPFPHLNDAQEFADRVTDGALLAVTQWRQHGSSAESPSVGVASR
jgi:hypothetical protein